MSDSVHFPSFRSTLPSLDAKTVAITGTTSGTGRVAASVAAELGAKVLLLNRSSSRSSESFDAIRRDCPNADVIQIECDLQSFESVRNAAAKIHAECPEGLDVLCNNAGVMALEDKATADGFDVQMQTNHLSHFLLTKELFPLLEQAAEARGDARIVNHSSIARMNPKKVLIADYLEKRGGSLGGNGSSMFFGGARWVRYNQTKLANCAFTAALHQKLQARGSRVKALVAHPGFARTQLQQTTIKDGGMGKRMTGFMMRHMAQSTEDGTMGILSAMFLPSAQSGEFYGPGSGSYAMKGKAEAFALEPFYDNEATRELLWSKSCEAIESTFEI